MRRLTTLTLITVTSLSTQAAKYVRTWADIEDLGKGLTLERTYNSHSLTDGNFGFGWCTELDTKLEPTRDGRLKLKSCNTNNELIFISRSSNTPTPRAGMPDRSPAFSPRVGGSFLTTSGETVEFNDGIYTLYRNGSPLQKFDRAGRLIEWKATNGIVHRVKRNVFGHPVFWSNSKGAKLSISTDNATGRILEVKSPGRSPIRYQYNGQNLVFVRQADGFEWNYLYDDLHNLTRTSSTEGFVENVNYDKLRDEVISVQRQPAREIR